MGCAQDDCNEASVRSRAPPRCIGRLAGRRAGRRNPATTEGRCPTRYGIWQYHAQFAIWLRHTACSLPAISAFQMNVVLRVVLDVMLSVKPLTLTTKTPSAFGCNPAVSIHPIERMRINRMIFPNHFRLCLKQQVVPITTYGGGRCFKVKADRK